MSVHSGRAGGIIEQANGLLQSMPSFHADPFSLITDDLREAETVERAAARFFEQQILGNEFWGGVSRDILAYGRAYIKTLTSPSEWIAQAGYPVRKAGEKAKTYLARVRAWKDGEANFPFIISHIPSLNLLAMVDQNNHIEASLEEKFVPAHIIADDMGSKTVQELIKNRSIDWYDQLSVMEYIDLDWVGYFLTSTEPREPSQQYDFNTRLKEYETLRVWQHNMGIHPIVLIPGIVTGDQEYKHRYRSFIADAKEDLETYDRLLSRLMTMVWAHYLPSYVWELPSSSKALTTEERPSLEVMLGGTTTIIEGEKLYPLPIQPNLPPAELLMQQVDDMIQRLTIDDILYGRVQGAAPAYQVNLRINIARCADVSDRVLTPSGYLSFGDIVRKGPRVELIGKNGKVITAKAELDKVVKLNEITLESGEIIRRTDHHRLWVGKQDLHQWGHRVGEFRFANEIDVGEAVAVLTKLPIKIEQNDLLDDPDKGLILGLLLGDGFFDKFWNNISIGFENKEIEKLFLDAMQRLGVEATFYPSRSDDNFNVWYVPKKSIIHKIIQGLDLYGKKSRTKELPDWTRALPNDIVVSILRGLLLSDGYVENKMGSIRFGVRSKELCNWVAFIAHRLGCPGSVRKRKSAGDWVYEWRALKEFIPNLTSHIGLLPEKKNSHKLEERSNRYWRTRNTPEGFHWQKVKSIETTAPTQTVCVEVLDSEDDAYCTPVLEHNSKLSPIAQHMANGITNVLERLFRGIEALGEAVSIDGETITTSMAKKFRNRVTASITPKSPIDRSQDIGVAVMAVRDLGMPWDWAVEHILNVEDPATLRLMNDIRKLEDSEPLIARKQQDALEQLNILIEEEDFEDTANINPEEVTPEFIQAIRQVQEGQGVSEGTGLGRGPFPEGAAPQTISPRGLNTPNAQPQPGTAQINSQGGII